MIVLTFLLNDVSNIYTRKIQMLGLPEIIVLIVILMLMGIVFLGIAGVIMYLKKRKKQ